MKTCERFVLLTLLRSPVHSTDQLSEVIKHKVNTSRMEVISDKNLVGLIHVEGPQWLTEEAPEDWCDALKALDRLSEYLSESEECWSLCRTLRYMWSVVRSTQLSNVELSTLVDWMIDGEWTGELNRLFQTTCGHSPEAKAEKIARAFSLNDESAARRLMQFSGIIQSRAA